MQSTFIPHPGPKESTAKTMGIPSEAILYTWFHDDEGTHCPKFILFKDANQKSIVLTIRGTFSIKDAVTDAICEETPFAGGFAHKGILEGGQRIISLIKETLLKALADNPGYKVTLTGHSLGAGTAKLIHLDLHLGDNKAWLPKGTKVDCLALAPPPVFRSKTGLPKEIKDAIRIFVHNNDIGTRKTLIKSLPYFYTKKF